MPAWNEILNEITEREQVEAGKPACDSVRRDYLSRLTEYTGRPTFLYATNFTGPNPIPPMALSIMDEDVQGLMTVIHGTRGPNLDLIIHSPGGSAEATEAMVKYLRTSFDHIRAIIPQAAMSAATMLACSCDEIVMGKHSSIGPVDPQLFLDTSVGTMAVPAQAILDQFLRAQEECQDYSLLASWAPILGQYGPALLTQCQNAIELSEELVKEWLERYMLRAVANGAREARAGEISTWLSDHATLKSHGRHIDRETAREHGLKIINLEDDSILQDLVLSVFHAATHTFTRTSAVKIIENDRGNAYIKHMGLVVQRGPETAPDSPTEPGEIREE